LAEADYLNKGSINQMHALSDLAIRNYRSCRVTDLQLHAFTPIVGYNNAGKSNILNAIE